MPDKKRQKEISQRRSRADDEYFAGLFGWGFTTREMEIAAEEYMHFLGELDLTEAHDHKDDRWRQYKKRQRGKGNAKE
jgi:hypothetical protein